MATAPKIGQLKSRLVFQKDTKVSDGSGGYTSTKSTDFTLWGWLRQLSESESLRNGQEVGYNTFEAWVLYQASMLPTRQHTVTNNNRTFTINGVQEINEANRWIRINLTLQK
jgi:SPP1 family predicted phage head-tail adaptor